MKKSLITGIERFRRMLAKANGDVRKRHKALKYLIHLVGDLHQPLHAGDNQDRGGNDLQWNSLARRLIRTVIGRRISMRCGTVGFWNCVEEAVVP